MVFSKIVPTDEELSLHYERYPLLVSVTETTRKRFREILDQLEPYRQTNNMIDVGCGEGFFLEEAIKRGWNVYGTEYADLYIRLCEDKGIRMRKGQLDPTQYPAGSFDVILSFEVIEHILHPVEEVRAFHRLLRKGGAVYLTTPNFNALSRRVLGKRWSIISFPDHLSYYTTGTLRRLFEQHGFATIWVRTSGISIERIRQYLTGTLHGAKANPEAAYRTLDHSIQESLERRPLLRFIKRLVNGILNAFGLGDAMKATFVKTGN
jgi:2-polyprenyl-3-methyl-5-hydroxy-6-metoxy-1,4-benzoquinol methylase